MPERITTHYRNAAAYAAAASLLLTSASTSDSMPKQADIPGLKRCYDQPQPKQISRPHASSSKPIAISRNPDASFTAVEQALTETAYYKLSGATVKIIGAHGTASGYIAETDKRGSTVVTAAHVIYDHTKGIDKQGLGSFLIEDRFGGDAKVVDGCYMKESAGEFVSLTKDEVLPIDVAVLRLAKPLGNATLKTTTEILPRGSERPYFFNYQDDRGTDYPATYGGMMLDSSQPQQGYEILTGIDRYEDCAPRIIESIDDTRPVSQCTIEPGASGGVVADTQTGDVIGISVGGIFGDNKRYLTPGELYAEGNVQLSFNTGEHTRAWPVIATVVPANIIDKALESKAYLAH